MATTRTPRPKKADTIITKLFTRTQALAEIARRISDASGNPTFTAPEHSAIEAIAKRNMDARPAAWLALVPDLYTMSKPIAVAPTKAKAQKAGAVWCNKNLQTAGVPILPREVPTVHVDLETFTLTHHEGK